MGLERSREFRTDRDRVPLAAALVAVAFLAFLALPWVAHAHPMDGRNAGFVEAVSGAAPFPFLYLGAKHMVTGYDHLLFLVGVVFFLRRFRDVVLYVSLFTVGHSITLLAGVLGGLRANPYLIDAVIGFSVAYKGFENIGGFERVLGVRPDTRIAVLLFGLFHGFGLATKLQEFTVVKTGLVANILSFNAGVEVGQGIALTAVVLALRGWRSRTSFDRYAFATNTLLITAGFLLAGHQLFGYLVYP